ncbi:hypothetical protein ABHN11_00605 [Brevibacillus centrosporus]|uniref:hypothetical protein n=1 Tax=Brevibacillus centrosporus TaxID=54910 RepID=UPI003D2177AD
MGVKIEDIRIDYESLCLIQERQDTFIETNGTAKTTRQIESDEELEQLLHNSFGLAKEK